MTTKARQFGKWTVLEQTPGRYWKCRCECGRVKMVSRYLLPKGGSTQCLPCSRSIPHPWKRKYWQIDDTGLRTRWCDTHKNMIDRCDNPKNKSFCDYGGRGIYVAMRFYDRDYFFSFIKTLTGWDDRSLTLDRMDNNGPYVPGNLRMATRRQQRMNRRDSRTVAA